jgi:putative membrane protein insertion efficiency factor
VYLVRQSYLAIFRLAHRIYKVSISPLMGGRCRFHPTCSDYMLAAVESHGILRGLWLSLTRVCKCHPWHSGGFDYVPEVKQ